MARTSAHVPLLLIPLVAFAGCGGGTSSVQPFSSAAEASDPPEPHSTATPASVLSGTPAPAATPAGSAAAQSDEPAADELDWRLPPISADVALFAGFTPDPHEESVTSGGPIDASHLGGDCRGWATAAPAVDVTYEAGSMTLLRFYFVADDVDGDTTLIVNAPDGEWYCNDDASAGTLNPMVDFANPQAGLYDVWIGSYDEGAEVSGTLFVTELVVNSP